MRARARLIASRAALLLPEIVAHGAAFTVVSLILVSAGQPLFAEDTWWHLTMGEAYAVEGPRLEADPALHTATGPPAPAAWLADLSLYGVERAWGFQGLRAVHALLVATILGLAWSALRQASGSALFASFGTVSFGVLSAYRLFQLRPHLFTLLGALLLAHLFLRNEAPPPRWRVGAAVGLLALWANLHGAFLLGPFLLGAAVAGLALAAPLRPAHRARDRTRAGRLAAALGLGLLATLLNPSGARQHGLYFAAGGDTPPLEKVLDEWAAVQLFELPVPTIPPSLLAWGAVWILLLVTPCLVFLQARRWRREATRARAAAPPPGPTRSDLSALSAPASGPTRAGVDPALLGVAAASLLALLSAVRLLWLGIFPLLALGQYARTLALGGVRGPARRALASWGTALVAVLSVPGFVRFGDWPMISTGIHRDHYARPYLPLKYYAQAVWFLRDAELEGRLFNDYLSGNFLGYWLAPRMRVFVNGSLNVPRDVMLALGAILERRGSHPGETFVALLDRYGVDVFFGKGLPTVPLGRRAQKSTTTHLEDTTGWIPIFRNLRSALYLRDNERNRANLERVAAYYQREGVPFEEERGFDPERAIRQAPSWAVNHGLIPVGFRRIQGAARARQPAQREQAQHRLAALYATLGLYSRAEAIDRRVLGANPTSVSAARRLVWSLLHQRLGAESLQAAGRLASIAAPDDGLSQLLVSAAHRYAAISDQLAAAMEGASVGGSEAGGGEARSERISAISEQAAALVAGLPIFTPEQGKLVLAGVRGPKERPSSERGGGGIAVHSKVR